MKIFLDTGIFIHSEFMEPAIKETPVSWGKMVQVLPVHGLIRKKPDSNIEYQRQKEALFTVGRFIREGRIEAYSYDEIRFEQMRGKGRIPDGNALRDCEIHECDSALERSKFRTTLNFMEMISKGGRKDCKKGIALEGSNQIAFFEFLLDLRKEHVDALMPHSKLIGLTEFEIESLRSIDWFQFLCQRSGSRENYPDVFHLWTAERNGFEVFLTLETGLSELVSRVKNEKGKKPEIRTKVLRPLDLLQSLGVNMPDPVPIETDRFYHLHEVP